MQRVAALSQHLTTRSAEGGGRLSAARRDRPAAGGAGAGGAPPDDAEPYRFSGPPYDERAMVAFYNREGFVLVSGLIPQVECEAAVEAMWDALAEGDGAGREPVVRADRGTWPRGVVAPQLFDPAINALWNAEYLRLAALLSDGYAIPDGAPGRDSAAIEPPMGDHGLMAINTFPVAPEGGEEAAAWEMPGGHLDHCIPHDGFLTFPRPVRMSTMTFLNDCAGGEPGAHGGSTVVWPGSSRKFERLAASDPTRFELMIDLGSAREEARVGVEGAEQPIEIRHRAGDVLFYDIFTSHSGSVNTSQTPRFAFNVKWGSGKRVSEREQQQQQQQQ
jgi:hypothetical protein